MSQSSKDVLLPPEAPMAMPEQSLRQGRLKYRRLPSTPRYLRWRRLYLFGGTLVVTLEAAWLMSEVLRVGGMSLLDSLLLLLFMPLFGWVAFSFFGALAGFLMVLIGRGRKL
ncbi:MAG: glucan biosynthesis glucosyltransferase H, partial [Xanthomonadaceae bacterium]|nr:glucan biosynthesis glucosyltransferase H [Xanthomonadaceae bacterium]